MVELKVLKKIKHFVKGKNYWDLGTKNHIVRPSSFFDGLFLYVIYTFADLFI